MTLEKTVNATRVNCWDCRVGRAYMFGRGGFCPHLKKELQAGETLYLAGDVAERVWFLKSGILVLEQDDEVRLILPDSMVGAEAGAKDVYSGTVRAISEATLCWAPPWALKDRSIDGLDMVGEAP